MSTNLRIGAGQVNIHIDLETGDMNVTEGELTLDQWLSLSHRLTTVLRKEKLIKPEKQAPRSHGGPVKSAPWFLRPWYDKVQPKIARFD